MRSSVSSTSRTRKGRKARPVVDLLRREYLSVFDDKRFIGVVSSQALVQMGVMFMIYWGNMSSFMNDVLFTFPLLWVCVMALVYASPAISGEKENGMAELLKLSPVSSSQVVVSKLVFCLLQYPVFLAIYLPMMYLVSLLVGWFTFVSALVMVSGPYLAVYILVVLLMLLVSTAVNRNIISVVFGCAVTAYVAFLDSMIMRALRLVSMNPIHIMDREFVKIRVGTFPDPYIWGWTVAGIVILAIVLFLLVRWVWKGVRE